MAPTRRLAHHPRAPRPEARGILLGIALLFGGVFGGIGLGATPRDLPQDPPVGAPFAPGFLSGVIEVPDGLHFDLDTFGFFPSPTNAAGIIAELGPHPSPSGGNPFGSHVDHAPDPEVESSLGKQGSTGWQRLTTDQGRDAWFEILRADAPVVLRAVTRLTDSSRTPTDVQPLVCSGTQDLEVWWETRPEFIAYRVERRASPGTEYRWVADVTSAPYVDEEALPGERWGYRITGVDAEGRGGVPSEVQGSLGIAGVHRGRVRIRAGVTGGVDFVRGLFEPAGNDLVVTGTYGGQGAASFVAASGRDVLRLDPDRDMADPLGLWATPDTPLGHGLSQNSNSGPGGRRAIESGGSFLVPIRGGGLAHCTFEIVEDAYTIELDYELYLDAPVWPRGPRLSLEREGNRSFLSVDSAETFRVDSASVHDLILETQLDELVLGGERTALDLDDHRSLLELRVEGIDTRGRRCSPASLRLDLRERGVQVSEFEIGLGDAFSLELGRPVSPELADLACDRVDARGRTATLRAAHGGCNNFLRVLSQRAITATDLQAGMISFEPDALRWGPTLWSDARTQIRQVFLIRTRYGGYGLCRLMGVEGSPPRARLVVRFNPHAPVFRDPGGREFLDGSSRFDHRTLFGPTAEASMEPRTLDGMNWTSGRARLAIGQDLRIPSGDLGSELDSDLRYLQWNEQAKWSSLLAPNGICPADLPDYGAGIADRERLFESIRSIDPTNLRSLGQVRIAAETPHLDTFLLRCRDGGWAKLRVSPIEGSSDLDLRWTHGPTAAIFGAPPAEAELHAGLVLDRGIAFGLEPDAFDGTEITTGTFALRLGEGWSFRQAALADDFAADLVLEHLSGPLDGLRLRAEGGIRTAEDLGLESVGNDSEPVLFRRIIGLRRASIWDFNARVDRASPGTRVLLLRTRDGGSAKLLVEGFGEGDRRTAEVRFRFVHVPSGTAFAPRPDELRFTDELILGR